MGFMDDFVRDFEKGLNDNGFEIIRGDDKDEGDEE
jgi:hypothetical protein